MRKEKKKGAPRAWKKKKKWGGKTRVFLPTGKKENGDSRLEKGPIIGKEEDTAPEIEGGPFQILKAKKITYHANAGENGKRRGNSFPLKKGEKKRQKLGGYQKKKRGKRAGCQGEKGKSETPILKKTSTGAKTQ